MVICLTVYQWRLSMKKKTCLFDWFGRYCVGIVSDHWAGGWLAWVGWFVWVAWFVDLVSGGRLGWWFHFGCFGWLGWLGWFG